MSALRLAIGAVALLAVMAESASSSARQPAPPRAVPAAGSAPLMAFGGRSAAQLASGFGGKMDAALADLVRHAGRARPGHTLEDLHALSPAARFQQHGTGAPPLVAIDAVTRGDPRRLEQLLLSLGLEHPAVFANDVGGWLPVSSINAAVASPEVHSIRAALWHTRAGAVTSQGDFAQGSAAIRTAWPTLTGSGVMVGVMSDSYDCYYVYAQPGSGVPVSGYNGYAPNHFTADAQQDITTGDLPASVTVLKEGGQGSTQGTCLDYGPPVFTPYADEGRAIMQVVHDVAPGASLAFYTAAETEADFANGIGALATAGAKVVVDDVGYFDEPFFQDGILAQAIDAVEAKGVAYFSAAGNDSNLAYDNTAPSFATQSPSAANENLLTFGTTGTTAVTALPVTIPQLVPGQFLAVVVEWDQPYVTGAPGSAGASSQIDLCVTGAGGYTVLNLNSQPVTCTGPNALGTDPVQVLVLANPANLTTLTAQTQVSFTVGLVKGGTVPGLIKLAVEDDGAGSTIDSFATNSPILQGHPGAAGNAAVGAALFFQTPLCGTTPALLEPYSSEGGAAILFDTSGNRLATPVVRQKPDFVAPDGVNNTFNGFTLMNGGITDNSTVPQCANNANYPNFFGTSAAAPHAAALAALMLQANPAITPSQIYAAMRTSAAAMAPPTPNFNSGFGFLRADAALALLPPAAPTLSLASTSITAGSSTTLTWASVNTTGCTASGSWSGSEAVSGSQMLTPAAMGTYTYTLSCANATGSSPATSVNLMVQPAPPSSGGGGGALDGVALLALAALAQWRRRRAPAPR
jgi:hypothetical protein